MHPFDQVRTVEDRLEYHFAPVALHFRITFERGGQVIGLLAHAQVHLVEVPDLLFERKALLRLFFVHLLDFFAEPLYIVAERLKQQLQRFAVRLLELVTLLLEYLGGEILELHALPLLQGRQLLFLACKRLVARREFLRQGSLAYRRFGQLHRLPGELVTQRPDLLFTLSRLLPQCFAFEREPPQNRTVSQHRPGRPYEQPYQYPQYRHMISVESAAQLPIPFTKIVNFADF